MHFKFQNKCFQKNFQKNFRRNLMHTVLTAAWLKTLLIMGPVSKKKKKTARIKLLANSWQHRWMHFLYLPSLRCPRIISPRGVGGAVTVSQPLRRQPHHFPWRPYWAVLAPSTQILTVLKTSAYSFFYSYIRGKFFTPALALEKFF